MTDRSESVPTIGRCIGCDRPSRIFEGVCDDCLQHRGRRWAELAHRCRTDLDFARVVYARIESVRGRELFVHLFGPEVVGEGRAGARQGERQSQRQNREQSPIRLVHGGRGTSSER